MSPHLPVTPDAIIAQAVEAAEAGAAIIHLHARDPETLRPTPDLEIWLHILSSIAEQTDAVLNMTTGGSTFMSIEDRLKGPLAAAPELCSCNMGPMNFGTYTMINRYKGRWKHDWEEDYLEASRNASPLKREARQMQRREFLAGMAVMSAGAMLPRKWAHAQSRADSLRILSEGAANSFDSFSVGVNRQAIQVTWNVYDRLVTFGTWLLDDSTRYFDYFDIQPELAERYEIAGDQRSITFHLRQDAVFHDGSPVTAEDVKWSLDRVVASPIGLSQFSTGSMTEPDQFVVVDEHTFRVDLPRPDRFTLPNLALTYPIIVNSKLARQHATEADPFASQWLINNEAGGGAYRIESHAMGERILFSRFDDWKSGPLPSFLRVLWQTVPAAESRVASLVRGDTDISQDLPPKDAADLAQNDTVEIIGVPMSGTFHFIGMNGRLAPFDNVKVRQAIAYALPYQSMYEAAMFGRGRPLFGGKPGEPETIEFPQPLGYDTDPNKAKELLAEAGLADGFDTSFTFDLSQSTIAEPISILIQEALGQIGVKVEINKVPAGQLGTLLQNKEVPFYFEGSTAYLSDPDYFFRIFYHGDSRWNFGAYDNPEFKALVDKTRFETDKAVYETSIKRMITLAKEDIPIILLWQPTLDFGMQKDITGYKYYFHRMLDFRPLSRE